MKWLTGLPIQLRGVEVVIQGPELETPLVTGFYWYFTNDELIEDGGKLIAKFEVDTVKWVPKTESEAYRWYMYSPSAAPLRAKPAF